VEIGNAGVVKVDDVRRNGDIESRVRGGVRNADVCADSITDHTTEVTVPKIRLAELCVPQKNTRDTYVVYCHWLKTSRSHSSKPSGLKLSRIGGIVIKSFFALISLWPIGVRTTIF